MGAPNALQKSEIKAIQPIEEVRLALGKMEDQFKRALPAQMNPEKFIRVAITAIQQNPDLLMADRHSLYGACMKAAQDGLLPDGRESVLVVYNSNIGTKTAARWIKKVQYQPMVTGILKKIRNSGELGVLNSHVVHQDDEFRYWIDEQGEHLSHHPKMSTDRGTPTHAYAIAKTKSGEVYIEVMTFEEIEKVRASSKSSDSGPWKNWWGEMARKTVIRRLSKRLPMSTDLIDVIQSDDSTYDLNKTSQMDASKTNSSRLSQLVEESMNEPQEIETEKPDQSELAVEELPNEEEFK